MNDLPNQTEYYIPRNLAYKSCKSWTRCVASAPEMKNVAPHTKSLLRQLVKNVIYILATD